jgi:tetratricopeptide (TPR) repeat protein
VFWEKQMPAAIGAADNAALILLDAGKFDEAAAHADKAGAVRDAATLPDPVKEGARIGTTLIRARIVAAQKSPEAAQAVIDTVKADIDRRTNAFEARFLHETLGLIALAQGNAPRALAHLAKADVDDPYVLFHQAEAHAKAGDSAAAAKLYRRVANWNSNSLRYALVRAEALQKGKKT